MSSDREHWDALYSTADRPGGVVPHVQAVLSQLPKSGTALDIAGGTGGTALALAEHGLTTTLLDVSPVALQVAADAAAQLGLRLDTVAVDLSQEPLPTGPWDVVVCANYLQRDLFNSMVDNLAPSGWRVVAIATETNLERNDHPSARFLLGRGELARLTSRLEAVSLDEDWFDGRHEARLVAQLG